MALRTHQLSPFNSPTRKRQKTGPYSPAYDDDFPVFSQEDFDAIDKIEAKLSQGTGGHHLSSSFDGYTADSHPDDPDNPFLSKPIVPALVGFKTGAALLAASPAVESQDDPHLSNDDDEPPPEVDYSSWFDSGPIPASAGFQSASSVKSKSTAGFQVASSVETVAFRTASSSIPPEAASPVIGFSKASKGGGIIMPSAAALAKAQAKLQAWQADDDPDPPDSISQAIPPRGSPTPATPSPAAFRQKPPSTGQKTFKSPLIMRTPASNRGTVQTPISRRLHPLSRPPVSAGPSSSSFVTASTSTPVKPVSKGSRPAPFVTPFKTGMKAGEPGRHTLQSTIDKPKAPFTTPRQVPKPIQPVASSSKVMLPSKSKPATTKKSPERVTLATCGKKPRKITAKELSDISPSLSVLKQITPRTAQFFSFHASDGRSLGPPEALQHLLKAGCKHATQVWVDNHWSMVLWKLAGMAILHPQSELDDCKRRWCWEEVLKQLLHRYEKEINQGSRPPLRLIAAQDKSPLSPMVLCISEITWTEQERDEEGLVIPPIPQVEVTDGWYRIRTRLDETLISAARRGLLRAGRKIGVMNASIISQRNEPSEILDAYDSIQLQLNANSCHLAPWHARLGFQPGPWVSSLHSLDSEGGKIGLMDLTVLKVHPVAFLETTVDEEGERVVHGPWTQAEENRLHDSWMAKRERIAEEIRMKFASDLERYEGYIARLEAKKSRRPQDDVCDSGHIESLYEDLADSKQAGSVIQKCTPQEARDLAKFIQVETESQKEKASEALAASLNDSCPFRDVSNFRAVTVQDTYTHRRPKNRIAHLTIRDALKVQLYDSSKPGEIKVGDRFLVTNVRPTQPKAWMGREEGDEIWLSTIARSSAIVGLKP